MISDTHKDIINFEKFYLEVILNIFFRPKVEEDDGDDDDDGGGARG